LSGHAAYLITDVAVPDAQLGARGSHAATHALWSTGTAPTVGCGAVNAHSHQGISVRSSMPTGIRTCRMASTSRFRSNTGFREHVQRFSLAASMRPLKRGIDSESKRVPLRSLLQSETRISVVVLRIRCRFQLQRPEGAHHTLVDSYQTGRTRLRLLHYEKTRPSVASSNSWVCIQRITGWIDLAFILLCQCPHSLAMLRLPMPLTDDFACCLL
jgi:hypothetical protein